MTNQAAWQPIKPPQALFRGDKRLRVALVGQPRSGKSEIFQAVSSVLVDSGTFAGTDISYNHCQVQVGLDEIELMDLPSFFSLRHLQGDNLESLKYLLWGNQRPHVSTHEYLKPPAPFPHPDVMIHVIDATALGRSLELSLELMNLQQPLVLAINMMDQAKVKGMDIDCSLLEKRLGIPVVSTAALEGRGISTLFERVLEAARKKQGNLFDVAAKHLKPWQSEAFALLSSTYVFETFDVPPSFLVAQLLEHDAYFSNKLTEHFPSVAEQLSEIQRRADAELPRTLATELDVDRHHRAMQHAERVTGFGKFKSGSNWVSLLDKIMLHPQWGIVSSLSVFALILFVVFKLSSGLDAITSAPLIDLLNQWYAVELTSVIFKAVAEGLVSLIGIVMPYMLPLVLLMIFLEQTGVMARIAFVVDRFFHHIGLHGNVAFPFLLGLGCNVPAIAVLAKVTTGRDKLVATLLATFIPCSARSAIILALGGMVLGGLGVFFIFMLNIFIIAALSRLLIWQFPHAEPGQIQTIPPFRWPRLKELLLETWFRIQDVLTIVTPLLVAGTVILALLQYMHIDTVLNTILSPITVWWLGLPALLGVPLLFGILRKELSLVMMFQALGVAGVAGVSEAMDWVQILTFLIFVTFYVPCVSTIAMQLKVVGAKAAAYSVFLSTATALIVAMFIRLLAEIGRFLFL
ncbi:MAG: hypothetical protein AUK35_05170 [Zetaproteobacteria bacterium CG2_30_46_52]|nr:MAG: hypothetical protein AUK35_05170 [Zetaproteobacteria bacterium CG2_30_46_52]